MKRARLHLLASLLFLAVLAPARDAVRPLTILHFNDLHAALQPDAQGQGGMASLAATIRHEREGCPSCVLLVAGDLVQGTPVSTIFEGVPVYQIANHLGIDAATLGNHEFDYGWKRIPEFIRIARFPIIAANVRDRSGAPLTKASYRILRVNGVRVGVIGALTADLPKLAMPQKVGQWRASSVVESARKYAAELRGQTDVIVLLGHLVAAEEDAVLREVPEIPVIISGHVHTGLDQPRASGDRLLVRVRANGRELGRLDLKVDVDKKKVVSAAWKRIPVESGRLRPAEDVAELVNGWEEKVSKIVDVPIGEAKRTLLQPDVRLMIEKATAEAMGTDFAFMNRGGVRAPLPAGRILARHVWNIYPFDNMVVVGKCKGRDLPPAVAAGKGIEPDRVYTLAVNDFVATHQRSELGADGVRFSSTGPLLRDVLINWIKKKRVIE